MRTKTNDRRIRFPAPHEDSGEELAELVFHVEEDAPCSEYIMMSWEYDIPALDEYLHELRELGSQTIH